jgi:hypothetical protein
MYDEHKSGCATAAQGLYREDKPKSLTIQGNYKYVYSIVVERRPGAVIPITGFVKLIRQCRPGL